MTAAPNDNEENETSLGQVLPQLRLKKTTPARGILSPPRATQQRQPMPHLNRLSDAAADFPCARFVEIVLYFWTAVGTLLGIILAFLVLYMLYFKNGGNLAPTLPFHLAAYGGLATAIACCIGIYGLLHHRKLVTEAKRNYALGMYIALGAMGAIVVIVAGAMAMSIIDVIGLAQEGDFSSNRVVVLETNVILRLYTQVTKSNSNWRDTQNELQCCGYDQVSTIHAYLSSSWDSILQTAVEDVNAVGSWYCSTRMSDCVGTTSEQNCPVPGSDWCRVELLQVARQNYTILFIYTISLGTVQVVFSALGLFTLLCDVRRDRGLSPTYRMQHRTLSPIQPSIPTAEV